MYKCNVTDYITHIMTLGWDQWQIKQNGTKGCRRK